MSTKISKKGLSTLMHGESPDEPSTGTTLRMEQGPESHLLLLDTVNIDFELEEVIRSESILIANDLFK